MLVLFVTVAVFCYFWNVILYLNPLSTNVLLYKSLDLLNGVSYGSAKPGEPGKPGDINILKSQGEPGKKVREKI